jgi:hypothetical protein
MEPVDHQRADSEVISSWCRVRYAVELLLADIYMGRLSSGSRFEPPTI